MTTPAPTAWQSALQYRAILAEAADKPFERFIYKYAERPYPRIILKHNGIGESTMWFMSAADDAERIQGVSLDSANIDECGVLIDGTWLLTMLISRLRGTVNLRNGRERPRQRSLSCITANYEVAPPWLWERMDRMFAQPEYFLSGTPDKTGISPGSAVLLGCLTFHQEAAGAQRKR